MINYGPWALMPWSWKCAANVNPKVPLGDWDKLVCHKPIHLLYMFHDEIALMMHIVHCQCIVQVPIVGLATKQIHTSRSALVDL